MVYKERVKSYESNLVILWRIPCMEKILMYLNDKEIARKITECVSSATGNDIQEHIRKIRRHNGSPSTEWVFINARHTLFHVDHGKWLLYTVRRTAVFTLLCEKNAFQNCRERK